MALFSSLTDRLTNTFNQIVGRGRLTEKNISETLKTIRAALLEADVALPVVKKLINVVRSKAIGQDITKSLKPGEMLVKIVHQELVELMGGESSGLALKAKAPVVILMAGLQGTGKTTTSAKLAVWIKEHLKKEVMLTSTDVYRPAAIEQLKVLAEQIKADTYIDEEIKDPLTLAKKALESAKKKSADVLIVDTAGRLHIDQAMMEEIQKISDLVHPSEILFVVDSMTGQDAAVTAKAFNDALPLTGVILTKADGDSRGGAALSIRHITEKPIKFMGVGERLEDLELFHPDRIASRILGMGDVLSLVEEVERKIDRKQAEKMAKKVKAGQTFTLIDFQSQLEQMKKMGGVSKLMEKMPGMPGMPDSMDKMGMMGEAQSKKMTAVIQSMTVQERRFPDIIKFSRKQRIAKGSGTQLQDVNQLLKQFSQMQKMMKKMKGGNQSKLMRRLKQLQSSGMMS
jgi:signal recognition particle subunit SRP54